MFTFLLFFVVSSYCFAWLTYFGLMYFFEHTTYYTRWAASGFMPYAPTLAKVLLFFSLVVITYLWAVAPSLLRAVVTSSLVWGGAYTGVGVLVPQIRTDGLIAPLGLWYGHLWNNGSQTQFSPQFSWEGFRALPKTPTIDYLYQKLGPPLSSVEVPNKLVLYYSRPATDSDFWQVFFSCTPTMICTKKVAYYID
jgi:hypothetical protein